MKLHAKFLYFTLLISVGVELPLCTAVTLFLEWHHLFFGVKLNYKSVLFYLISFHKDFSTFW